MQSLPKKLPPERHDRRFVIESPMPMQSTMHVYEVHPRKDHRGIDLISDALPFGRLWYGEPDNAIGYAMHSSRSHHAVIRVYDDAGKIT